MDKNEVAAILEEIAVLLELQGVHRTSPFGVASGRSLGRRVRRFRLALQALERLPHDVQFVRVSGPGAVRAMTGMDVTHVNSLLADANAKVTDAKSKAGGIPVSVLPLQPGTLAMPLIGAVAPHSRL